MNKKIIFSGGGTGGHLFPAINLMKHFYEKGYKVILVTDNRGYKFIKENYTFKSYIINTSTPTNKKLFKKILAYISILFSTLKSLFILKKEKPDLIFALGGYVSFPISLASKFFNLPLVIYENNMVLGRANKFLSNFSKKIFLAKKIKDLPTKFKKRCSIVGTILDKEIINCKPTKINNKKFSVLVLGGSQGAEVFGFVVPEVIKMIKDKGHNVEIIQQCTKGQKEQIKKFYEKNDIKNHVFEFKENIIDMITSCDLAITRCGASTTAELVHTLTPFIAVPLPGSIDNHQYMNAKYYEEKGCCWILEQKNFNLNNLYNLIIENINDKNKLEIVHENMKKIFNKSVYFDLENQIKELI